MTAKRGLLILLACSAAIRLVWAATMPLGHDEAYHYLFTVHQDWSYFDHPPLLAWVEAIGPTIFGSTAAWSLRFGFILLFAGSTWLMFRLTERSFGPKAGLLAALALNISAYHTAAVGAFALPDGPLLFFWLLTLDRIDVALRSDRPLAPWVAVGLAWGGALLSKYHAVLLPAGLLAYIVLTPGRRKLLLKPGPYVATIIGVLCFTPVLYWNAKHGWASFLFQGGRAVAKPGFNPLSLLGAIGGQIAYLLPWIWLAMIVAIYDSFRTRFQRQTDSPERFLFCVSLVPLGLFSAVACIRPILPHWTLVGFLSIYPLVGRYWSARLEESPAKWSRRLRFMAAVPVVVAAFMIVQYHTGVIPINRFVKKQSDAVRADPTAELYGWDQVAQALKSDGLLDADRSFLFTSLWYHSGHLGYSTRDSGVPVACYSPNDARGFAFWSNPKEWLGRDGILVSFHDTDVESVAYRRYFSDIELAGQVPIIREGKLIRTAYFYRCKHQTQPFPFDYGREAKRKPAAQIAAGTRERR